MSRAEEQALKAYPAERGHMHDRPYQREGFVKGYNQAQQDTIERACQLLYDWNNQMTMIFGVKAILSCSQFTIDVDRFRKNLKLE